MYTRNETCLIIPLLFWPHYFILIYPHRFTAFCFWPHTQTLPTNSSLNYHRRIASKTRLAKILSSRPSRVFSLHNFNVYSTQSKKWNTRREERKEFSFKNLSNRWPKQNKNVECLAQICLYDPCKNYRFR